MPPRLLLLALPWVGIAFAPSAPAFLPAQYLPIYGGSGGSGFTRSCGAGKVLTGLTYRSGLLMDAVGVLCRPVSSTGALGSESTVGTLAGGGGGTANSASCDRGLVVMRARIYHGSYVNGISLVCQGWDPTGRNFLSTPSRTLLVGTNMGTNTSNVEACEAPTQPANGIRGRAHSLVDAIGFICDEP